MLELEQEVLVRRAGALRSKEQELGRTDATVALMRVLRRTRRAERLMLSWIGSSGLFDVWERGLMRSRYDGPFVSVSHTCQRAG